MDLCRKLDTETMGPEILLAHVVDTGMEESARLLAHVVGIGMEELARLHANAADIGPAEWVMQRGRGHRLAVAVVQERLLGRSDVAEREVKERRPGALGTDAVVVERESGRVCVSRGAREALERLLGRRVSSW